MNGTRCDTAARDRVCCVQARTGGLAMRLLLCTGLIGSPLLMSFLPLLQEQRPDLSRERRQTFDWMTKLGYPETKDLTFVLVATGDWLQHGNNAPENRFQYGFLMEERGNVFKILSLDLEVQTFEKTPPRAEAHKAVGYEIVDIEKEALA